MSKRTDTMLHTFHHYVDSYAQFNKTALDPYLQDISLAGFERFKALGLPHKDQEEYKYNNLDFLNRLLFNPYFGCQGKSKIQALISDYLFKETRNSSLVFINGTYCQEYSNISGLPESIIVEDLNDAAKKHPDLLYQYLQPQADTINDGMFALSTAFISSGAFIYIPKNVQVKSPIQLLFFNDPMDTDISVFYPRTLLVVDQFAEVDFISHTVGLKEHDHFINSIAEIIIEEGGKLNFSQVQQESYKTYHMKSTAVTLGKNSTFEGTTVSFGGKYDRQHVEVTMKGENANCHLYGLTFAFKDQELHHNTVINHNQSHGMSHQLFKSILNQNGRGSFTGRIIVSDGTKDNTAEQLSKGLLLSKESRIDTRPQLEILTDDVKCSHGATVGQLNDDEMFYLNSRGIKKEDAKLYLTFAFSEEIIEKIKLPSLVDKLNDLIMAKLTEHE